METRRADVGQELKSTMDATQIAGRYRLATDVRQRLRPHAPIPSQLSKSVPGLRPWFARACGVLRREKDAWS